MTSVSSHFGGIGIATDLELQKVIDIAAHVGHLSGDDVNVSYTGLFIGLLWSDDATSLWLQAEAVRRGLRSDVIYATRNQADRWKDQVLGNLAQGISPAARRDYFSVSARTLLQEAQSIALETGLAPSDRMGTRHLAAAFFFRNPPGHDRQLHIDWGVHNDVYRRAFARFVEQTYPAEVPSWEPILEGYTKIRAEPHAAQRPHVSPLAHYEFDLPALRLLRTVEAAVLSADSSDLTSERLLRTLAAVRADPDCETFAELVAGRLEITDRVSLVENPSPFGKVHSHVRVSRGLRNILDRARTLARSTTGGPRIGTRHVIAALLVAPDSSANEQLVASSASIPLLRQRLFVDFTRRWIDDDGGQWRFHLIGQTPPTVAPFNADSADTGDDKLDVTRFATAFASVLAADKVTPPLSIGIFGDWGSGKSFFMRLMQDQTRRAVESDAIDDGGARLFCRRVVPIRFNAWHYADRNLWASLVQTIFVSLRTAIVGDREDTELMDRIIARLETTRLARKEAEQRVDAARQVESETRARLDQQREQVASRTQEIEALKATDVVAVFRQTVATDVKLDRAAMVAETYLEIPRARALLETQRKTTGQVLDFVSETRMVAARSRSAIEWLAHAPVRKREIYALLGALVAILLTGLAIEIAYHDRIRAAWPLVSTAFIQGGTVVALGLTWARRHLLTISRGLDQFDELRAEMDARVASQRASAQQLVDVAEQRQKEAAASLERAEADLAAATSAVRAAEEAMAATRSANRIAQLVEQRITGKSYEQYLGLVDAIRKDFQSLTDLMKQLRAERSQGDPSETALPIDRIVLYIDDLDRCPSATVVAVLEAIHLLLAFELFVVVVGVDVRWAAQSLTERYPKHLTPGRFEGGFDHTMESDNASALDYLEKIFQVPFWLPPMDEQASRNMIADLVPRPKKPLGDVEEAPSGRRPHVATAIGRSDSSKHGGESAAGEPAGAGVQAPKAQPLLIEAEERNYMLSLADAVGKSPRRLKRFVNTYRIFKGSIDALSRETFVLEGGARGDYRAAMTLLALITGAPRTSLALLRTLAAQPDTALFTDFERCVEEDVFCEERVHVEAAMRAYRTACNNPTLRVSELKRWLPEVTRFSFRSGRW